MSEKPFDLKQFVIKELRRAFKRSPMYSEAKRRAKEEFFIESKHGKNMRRVHLKCAKCGKFFVDKSGAREVAVDHIIPVIAPSIGFVDWNTYLPRLFSSIDNLQILCNFKGERDGIKSCHKIKTAAERAVMAERNRQNKPPKAKKGKKI